MAGRSRHSLLGGLARHGAEISAATVTGALAQAGRLLVALEEAITARSRSAWHLHADETSWQVFAPREGGGPARWWLWVFHRSTVPSYPPDASTLPFGLNATLRTLEPCSPRKVVSLGLY